MCVVNVHKAFLYMVIPVILAVRAQGDASLLYEILNLIIIIKVNSDIVHSGVSSSLECISKSPNLQR